MLIVSFVSLAKLEIHRDKTLYKSLVISSECCNLFLIKPAFITTSLMIWSENIGSYSCRIHFDVVYTELMANLSIGYQETGPEAL